VHVMPCCCSCCFSLLAPINGVVMACFASLLASNNTKKKRQSCKTVRPIFKMSRSETDIDDGADDGKLGRPRGYYLAAQECINQLVV
jgi:hypothetical protein